jgi:gamma-glutamyltranspeptidase / glutathione hydrolase
MLDLGANLQAATDMARFHHSQVNDSLQLETDLYDLVGQQLIALGHKNTISTNGAAMGGYQAIMLTPTANSPEPNNGFYRAGSDHRKDGAAVGW